MNIFILDKDPIKAAQLQCDKHIVKMILESAQMLCTAHRVIDGYPDIRVRNGRSNKVFKLPDYRESLFYGATHRNHPCNVWVRQSLKNYKWLYDHFCALCDEYTHRYGKVHKSDEKLREALCVAPTGIRGQELTEFKLAIDREDCLCNDPVQAYRKYYQTKQDRFKMVWTNRAIPDWFRVA